MQYPFERRQLWRVFAASGFLVSVPVFFQAPLVRWLPELSLLLTTAWLALAWYLLRSAKTQLWGDLLLGFCWSWLAGSLYWGWLRQEPFLHLPVEAIAMPITLWGLKQGWGKIGHLFYLGSLLGTAITDLYFYLTGLIPYWRQVMAVRPEFAPDILRGAVSRVETPWGLGCALGLLALLFIAGTRSLQNPQLHWWAFSGAVLSTILVDGLFWLAVSQA
ncbi:MAG: DUF3120 domain-containing protein [Cyanobacteria bacterium P01_E01_bin.42]